jgi:hypothetical protein
MSNAFVATRARVCAAGLLLAAGCPDRPAPPPAPPADARPPAPDLPPPPPPPPPDAAPEVVDAAPARAAAAGGKKGRPERAPSPAEVSDPRGQGVVALGKINVSANLPKAEAEKIVRGKVAAFKRCYESELEKNPRLRGRMIMALTVSPIGSVSLADVQKSTFGGGDAEICVAKVARDLRFPKPSGGDGSVDVTIDFR